MVVWRRTMKALIRIRHKLAAVGLIFAILLFGGCYTVPETGRKAFIIIDEATEMKMGLDAYRKIKTEIPISSSTKYNSRVQKVGTRIAAVANQPNFEWEFTVFDAPKEVNAWCLPGGKIGVYTGLFQIVKSEGQLATVMAHEVGHAIAKHGAERISTGLILAVGQEAIASAMEDETAEDLENIEQVKSAYGVAAGLFVMLPFSRKHEYEADRIGLILMGKAGYDPRHAQKMWEAFAEYHREKGASTLEYLSTHPSDDKRIAEIKYYMPEALEHYYRATGRTPPEAPARGGEMRKGGEVPSARIHRGGKTGSGRKVFRGIKLDEDE